METMQSVSNTALQMLRMFLSLKQNDDFLWAADVETFHVNGSWYLANQLLEQLQYTALGREDLQELIAGLYRLADEFPRFRLQLREAAETFERQEQQAVA